MNGAAAEIRENADLMRWSERLDTDPPTPGSLADVWWNVDVPFLLGLLDSASRVSLDERTASAASRCVVGSTPVEVDAEHSGGSHD